MKQFLLMIAVVAVALVGCSKKNPPKPEKPEALEETVKVGFVMPVKPELPAALAVSQSSVVNSAVGVPEVETESERKERQRLEALQALHADAMQRYESEMANLNRRMEKSKRERERVKRNYELAMEEWYNSLVVCLHCDSDFKTKGAKVCAECGRNQRDGGKKPTPPKAFTNTLGMPFVPVPGTEVAFCIWETRVKGYAAYAATLVTWVDASWKNPFGDRFKQADTHPVVRVSWNDANAFCAWLTKKELAAGKIKAGQKYRLPTDAEWSVAVGLGKEKGNTPEEKSRGIKDVYPWGKEWPPPKEAGNYSKILNVDNFGFTSPVGNFAANKLGLHDMGGNVYEWCDDKYRATSSARVLRGASWDLGRPDRLLSSYRGSRTPVNRYGFIGFRCVLVGGSGG